jgi:hypothetical protein
MKGRDTESRCNNPERKVVLPRIAKGSQGSRAPDGKSILLIRDNQTFVRDLASGEEKLVTLKG